MPLRALRQELWPTVTLAGPVVLAEIGWMAMGIVDTLMVGRLGPEAIGAVGVGSMLFFAFGVFGVGVLLGLDPLVSQAFGARRLEECHAWLRHGIWLSLLLTVPLMAVLGLCLTTLEWWGFHPDVLPLLRPYLAIVTWSTLPLLLYATFRRYLQSMGVVTPVMVALVSANVVNAVANWLLIFGNWGAPRLGTGGAAWATVASRVYMASVLLAAIVWHERAVLRRLLTRASVVPGFSRASHSWPSGFSRTFRTLGFEWARMRRLVDMGLPAAFQIVLEVGVFAAATALAGRLQPAALAAHQIVLNIAGFTFMVPLGVGAAGGVRVGHAVGRRDEAGIRRAGWTALFLGGTFMALMALAFVTLPRQLVSLFSTDPGVLQTGVVLLFIAAVFQLFDGLQGVATGILRGLGDTRTPMIWSLAAHWGLGLPLGYALCFVWGVGVAGLWIGLSAGLIVVGVVLVFTWARRVRSGQPVGAPQVTAPGVVVDLEPEG